MASTTQKPEKFFNSGDLDLSFWQSYIADRPAPAESFFELINDYTGSAARSLAHDVGTGPGNIAARLAKYYDHVVGSDVNGQALAAAPALIPAETYEQMTLIEAPAERLATGVIPEAVGIGKTDLVVVSECMPLLDPVSSIRAFHQLLHPGGALAIYFYGRPLFADGNKEECDAIYNRIATKICTLLRPFAGTPSASFWQRGVTALASWLDNIELSTSEWERVERIKWNSDVPLMFNDMAGYDFEVQVVDRRSEGETTQEITDRSNWNAVWDIERVRGYFAGVYPHWEKKAGDRAAEIEPMLEELRNAMNGPRKIGFPVCLILATKK